MTIVRQIVDTTEGQIKNARTLVRRSWLVSLGAAGMAVDTTESTFNKFVRRGEKVAQATRKDLKKLNTRFRREQRELQHDVQEAEQNIEQRLTDVVSAFNIPTRRDLRVLDARIAQLNTQLHDLNAGETTTVEFPIHNYATLTAEEINAVLPSLHLQDLYAVELYEAANAKRVTVLREVERQFADRLSENGEIREPFIGYDVLRAEEVVAKLEGLGLAGLHHVKLYESTHAKRVTVQREVERRIEAVRSANVVG
ncbi:MAG: phasin family protein [Herpetosiphonaceae bacterium]|nr:phasin family protein [Herpetosiphonaceae bacterium]